MKEARTVCANIKDGEIVTFDKAYVDFKHLYELLKRMTFITNNFEWASSSVCDLYKARWAIEVFFKEIKQPLQLSDFMGYNESAVKWQLWTALLAYVLLRFMENLS